MKTGLLKISTIIVAMIAIHYHAFSQQTAPPIQWEKAYGGTREETSNCIRQTSDGGYIIAGKAISNDGDVTGHHGTSDSANYNYDVWIVKISNTGTLQWEKSYGGSTMDEAYSIQQTSDGGYIVAGATASNDGDVVGWHAGYSGGSPQEDWWILKLDVNGNIQWQKCLGGSGAEQAQSVVETVNGNFIIAGYTESSDGDVTYNHNGSTPSLAAEGWVVKLDNTGHLIWQKTYGGTRSDAFHSIIQAADGNYVVAGEAGSFDGDITGIHSGYSDFWIAKLKNTDGTLLMSKVYGGVLNDAASSIQQTANGDFVVAGYSSSVDGDVTGHIGGAGNANVWVLKTDVNGQLLWQKSYGCSAGAWGTCITKTDDGGYVLTASAFSNDNDVSGLHNIIHISDYWIIKLDNSGNMQWQKCLGGSSYDNPAFILTTNDHGYIITGTTSSNDGDVTGFHGGSVNGGDVWVVKLLDDTLDACINWPLTSDTTLNPVSSGNISGMVEMMGMGSSNPRMSVYGYAANGQELWSGNNNGWVQGPVDNNRFVQFDAVANSGSGLTVNNISFDYSDYQTGTDFNILAFKVAYSTDNWNTANFIGQATYLGTSVQTFTYTASPGIVVPPGSIFSLRIFPYGLQNSIAMTPSFATHKNVNICGVTYPVGCMNSDTVETHVTVYDTITVHQSVTDTLIINVGLTNDVNQNVDILKIYPNPTKDFIIIDNGNYSLLQGYSIKVTNILGQTVFNQPLNQQQFQISLNSWGGAGTYILTILDANQNVVLTRTILYQ